MYLQRVPFCQVWSYEKADQADVRINGQRHKQNREATMKLALGSGTEHAPVVGFCGSLFVK